MIEFQIAEDFFKDGIHHVGFSLSPFSDYFIMHTWLSSHFNLYSVGWTSILKVATS